MKIKVGRFKYKITSKDLFMDNGVCIQLMTQNKNPMRNYHRETPVLPQREVKRINQFKRVLFKNHKYPDWVIIFSLDITTLKRRKNEKH